LSFDLHGVGGRWPDPAHCPRCGSGNRITLTAGPAHAPERIAYCGLCRLPNPVPPGFALREHDDPEGLI
jgi:hypothetical protein